MGRGAKLGERRGGRAKGTPNRNSREIKAYAQQFGSEMIDIIAGIARDAKADVRTRLDAGKELLDRAYGRPAQPRPQGGNVGTYDLNKLTDEQLRDAYNILKLAAPDHVIGDFD